MSPNELQIVPFVEMDGGWILSDEFLSDMWVQLLDEDLMQTVFWEGNVSSVDEFSAFCKRQHNVLAFIFDDRECVGFAWLGPMSGNYAFAHFCLFRSIWGEKTTEVGQLVLRYWFDFPGHAGPLIDVIIGMVPGFNTQAHKFVIRLGMTRLGAIPTLFKNKRGDVDEAVIFYILRPNNGQTKHSG